jgi:acetylornithine/succinyldiaminopimelate/putrescine aminotransferase
VLRFLPPLSITDKEMKEGISRLSAAIAAFTKQAGKNA